ncbi:MAG: hypothetical protein RL011_141 [Pseudomonadota bacterium]
MPTYRRAYVEISNICNLQCHFCPEVERQKQVMTAEQFATLAPQLATLVDEVCLHLMGEPLNHPELASIIDICTKSRLPINLTTNGVLLNGARKDLLLSPIVRQVNISVHSFEANFPTRDVDPYLERILSFADEAERLRPDLYINLRLWDLKVGDEPAPNNQRIREILVERFGVDLSPASINIKRRKQARLRGRLSAHFDSRFIWPSLALPKRSEQGFCHGLGSHFGIHANGTVVPCCLDKEAVINLGNSFREPLNDILGSDRAERIRSGFQSGVLREELCQKCPFIARFDKKATKLRAAARV